MRVDLQVLHEQQLVNGFSQVLQLLQELQLLQPLFQLPKELLFRQLHLQLLQNILFSPYVLDKNYLSIAFYVRVMIFVFKCCQKNKIMLCLIKMFVIKD